MIRILEILFALSISDFFNQDLKICATIRRGKKH
jgi:hypothetical protein